MENVCKITLMREVTDSLLLRVFSIKVSLPHLCAALSDDSRVCLPRSG